MPRKVILSLVAVCWSMLSMSASALELHAFADVTYSDSSRSGENPGFSLGQLDLWGTHVIDKEGKLKTFVELVVESPGSGFVLDLERLWVEYDVNPNFRVRAGRFHTSLGYWNRTYHHGSHMQTTVFRPLFLDFEDGPTAIMPTHTVGLMGVGDFNMAQGDLHLEVQLGNGAYFNGAELDPNNAGDADKGKALVGRLVFKPAAVDGLGIGVSYLNNPVSQLTGGVVVDLVDQQIYGLDAAYDENDLELIFEYFSLNNKDTAGTSRTSSAWYFQAGYAYSEVLMPYFRYEEMKDIDASDPYFITLGTTEYSQSVLGVRYDLVDNSSLKLEARSLDEPTESSDSYWMQWTMAF